MSGDDNIFYLEDYREVWQTGLIWCWACRFEWTGVVHRDSIKEELECPSCGQCDSKYLDMVDTYQLLASTLEPCED